VFDPLGMTSTQVYDDHERLVTGRYSTHRQRASRRRADYANSVRRAVLDREDCEVAAELEAGEVAARCAATMQQADS